MYVCTHVYTCRLFLGGGALYVHTHSPIPSPHPQQKHTHKKPTTAATSKRRGSSRPWPRCCPRSPPPPPRTHLLLASSSRRRRLRLRRSMRSMALSTSATSGSSWAAPFSPPRSFLWCVLFLVFLGGRALLIVLCRGSFVCVCCIDRPVNTPPPPHTNTQTKQQTQEEASAVVQHHDGVSGTAKQHVAYDYAMRVRFFLFFFFFFNF